MRTLLLGRASQGSCVSAEAETELLHGIDFRVWGVSVGGGMLITLVRGPDGGLHEERTYMYTAA